MFCLFRYILREYRVSMNAFDKRIIIRIIAFLKELEIRRENIKHELIENWMEKQKKVDLMSLASRNYWIQHSTTTF